MALLLEPGPLAARLEDGGVTVKVAPLLPHLRSRSERRDIRRWIEGALRETGANIQHSVMAWTHALAGPAARRAGIAPVWYQHTPPTLSSSIDWWAACTSTQLIFANSAYTARQQRRLNLRRAPIEVVHPPIDEIAPQRAREDVRSTLGAHPGDVLVVLPGRIHPPKGHETAIHAVALVASQLPQVRLAVVGETTFGLDRGFQAALRRLVATLGLEDQVQFTGFSGAMGDVYAAADIVLQPSLNPEGFGLVTAEALAAGRAVIASDIGAIPELIWDGGTGLLVAPGDRQALASAIRTLAQDPELRTRLGTAAAHQTHATPHSAARRLEELYRKVLAS